VVPHAAYPFIVTGSNSVVRVLGTSFLVESHPGEDRTRVVVEEGKIVFEARNDGSVQERIIEQNQEGLFVTGNGIELQEVPDTKLFTGWKDGKLIFQKTPFAEVVKRLERWYDIDCIISDDAIKKEHFTSVFTNEPLLHVLDVIALSMNISYEIENQTINFKTDNL
jgi:ferric-dicitrate binding protein FerR (iron transport regulator)